MCVLNCVVGLATWGSFSPKLVTCDLRALLFCFSLFQGFFLHVCSGLPFPPCRYPVTCISNVSMWLSTLLIVSRYITSFGLAPVRISVENRRGQGTWPGALTPGGPRLPLYVWGRAVLSTGASLAWSWVLPTLTLLSTDHWWVLWMAHNRKTAGSRVTQFSPALLRAHVCVWVWSLAVWLGCWSQACHFPDGFSLMLPEHHISRSWGLWTQRSWLCRGAEHFRSLPLGPSCWGQGLS